MPFAIMKSILHKKHRRVQKIIINGEDLPGGAYHGANVRSVGTNFINCDASTPCTSNSDCCSGHSCISGVCGQ